MFKKLLLVCAVVGMSIGVSGSIGCGGGTEDMSKDKTKPPAEAPAAQEEKAEVPPDV